MRIVPGLGIALATEEISFHAEADVGGNFSGWNGGNHIQVEYNRLFATIGAGIGKVVGTRGGKGKPLVGEGQIVETKGSVDHFQGERPHVDGRTGGVTRAETRVGRFDTDLVRSSRQVAKLYLLVITHDVAVDGPGVGSSAGDTISGVGGCSAGTQVGRPGDDRRAHYIGSCGGAAEHIDLEFTNVTAVTINNEEVGIARHQAAGVEYGTCKARVTVGHGGPAGAIYRLVNLGLEAIASVAGKCRNTEADARRTGNEADPLYTVELWRAELRRRIPLRLVGIHADVTVDITKHTGLGAKGR